MYRGTRFRSRLEARWAAFFDALNWEWAYEPIDLDWYIPDFILRFPHAPVVVEVKPDMDRAALWTHAPKIARSGWAGEFLIVGSALFEDNGYGRGHAVGLLGDRSDAPPGEAIAGDGNVFRCLSCGRLSLLHDDCSYHCRVSGCWDGQNHIGDLDAGEVDGLWAAAGNRVQWRGSATVAPRTAE